MTAFIRPITTGWEKLAQGEGRGAPGIDQALGFHYVISIHELIGPLVLNIDNMYRTSSFSIAWMRETAASEYRAPPRFSRAAGFSVSAGFL
ncbi:hypothetical protein MASR2M78_21210 [Treponema sp.]